MKKRLLVLCLVLTIISTSLGICFAEEDKMIKQEYFCCHCKEHTYLGTLRTYKVYIPTNQGCLPYIYKKWFKGPFECPSCHEKPPESNLIP